MPYGEEHQKAAYTNKASFFMGISLYFFEFTYLAISATTTLSTSFPLQTGNSKSKVNQMLVAIYP